MKEKPLIKRKLIINGDDCYEVDLEEIDRGGKEAIEQLLNEISGGKAKEYIENITGVKFEDEEMEETK